MEKFNQMDKIKIAIVTGGLREERVISLKSAEFIEKNLNPNKYQSRVILLDSDKWYDRDSGAEVDKNDFSIEVNGVRLNFDQVYLAIHGTPVEDGKIQGYFDLLGLPYSTCDTFTSALSFNKQATKNFLAAFGIPMAPSVLLKNGRMPEKAEMESLGFPVFVKPNQHGSSFGISRADNWNELQDSCAHAYSFDREVVVEAYMEGREFSCGVVKKKGKTLALPVTEIIPETEFFDYAAKYEHKSEEITPAEISDSESASCRQLAGNIYDLMNCRGMVRVDFILNQGIFKMLELNTVPGLSPESIIPAQARALGWSYTEFLDIVIEDTSKK